jgi:hypothetical protein
LIRNGAFGSIHDWGTKKECWIEKDYKEQLWIFFIIFIVDCCMPIDKMMSS